MPINVDLGMNEEKKNDFIIDEDNIQIMNQYPNNDSFTLKENMIE